MHLNIFIPISIFLPFSSILFLKDQRPRSKDLMATSIYLVVLVGSKVFGLHWDKQIKVLRSTFLIAVPWDCYGECFRNYSKITVKLGNRDIDVAFDRNTNFIASLSKAKETKYWDQSMQRASGVLNYAFNCFKPL